MPASTSPLSASSAAPPATDDRIARELRGFGPLGIIAIVVIILTAPIAGAVLVLLWRWRSGTPWQAIGYVC